MRHYLDRMAVDEGGRLTFFSLSLSSDSLPTFSDSDNAKAHAVFRTGLIFTIGYRLDDGGRWLKQRLRCEPLFWEAPPAVGAPLGQPLGVLETFGRGVGSEMEKLVGKVGLDSE